MVELSPNDLIEALKRSGFNPLHTITGCACVGEAELRNADSIDVKSMVYMVVWDVPEDHNDPLTFCNTIYITQPEGSSVYYADI